MASIKLTKENFEDTITKNEMVIVDFWASWCGPCKAFAPVFEAASEKSPDVLFAKVNTEEQPELAQYFEVQAIPTLMVFREQVLLFAQPGALPANVFTELITKVRELDMKEVHAEIAKHREEHEHQEGCEHCGQEHDDEDDDMAN